MSNKNGNKVYQGVKDGGGAKQEVFFFFFKKVSFLFLKYSDKSFILKDNLSYSILLIFLTLASPSKLFGIELTSLLLSL